MKQINTNNDIDNNDNNNNYHTQPFKTKSNVQINRSLET